MIRDDSGLFVYRASRTERLADELAAHLETTRPSNPLQAQTVIVAHAGLRRWLLGEFARRPGVLGGHGIAANFDMILPWEWLERTARRTLGDAALVSGPYRSDLLRWHIFRALPLVDSAQITAYLAGVDGERRRFQLANHLAGVFTQYLIYRHDWILDWERGPVRDEHWQAALWRRVRAVVAAPHRAQRRDALLRELVQRGDGETLPLHIFGASSLQPDVLDVLHAVSNRRRVHVYFPDPCREHWVYLRDRRSLLRMKEDPQALYFEVGHPLLAALGRVAQDFCMALDEIDASEDWRDPMDEAEPIAGQSLLAQLQASIRVCEPDLVGAPIRAIAHSRDEFQRAVLALREDASLRVHACHTRLRELEVLRDSLLRALADDVALQHRDIVVMAPNIAEYSPYLPAVFGAAARYDADPAHIPWHLADVGLARAHPLMSGFLRMLDLAESRFSASDVLDFLDVPAVSRRFGIDADARAMLERSLRRAHVAWGLDAQMKEQAGAARVDANSWKFGFDRLFAGLLIGEETSVAAFDGILPLEGIGGTSVEALGQLDRLLGELRRARVGFAIARPLVDWSDWLLELIDAMFQANPRDDADQSALDTLRRLVADLALQGAAAGAETAVGWSVVRDAVTDALDGISERQPFLLGGVTFCGLVPQRSIPFRVVCLIGMNEGEFPRPTGDAGLNRMLAEPRPRDVNKRSEDRYLFLEALMSARERLHVSYIGESVRDAKPRNPASPLAELLQFLDAQHALQPDDAISRPWLLKHPLQPFDARYFRRNNDDFGSGRHDPRLFSFNRTFADLPVRNAHRNDRFLVDTGVPATETQNGDVTLASLRQFWRDPARDALLRGANLSLDALDDDSLPDREPLEAKTDGRDRVDRRLLFDALAAGETIVSTTVPSWLASSGALAAGSAGEIAYARAKENADAVLGPARVVLGDKPVREPLAIDLDLGDGLRLTGVVDRVFRISDGGLCLFDAKPGGHAGFRELLPFFVDLAALRLIHGAGVAACFVEKGKKRMDAAQSPALLESILVQDDAQLRDGLRRLVHASHAARTRPVVFFPKTAWAWVETEANKRATAARKAWQGDGFGNMGERDYAPGYAALLARDLDFLDHDSPAHAGFIAAIELVADVLDPQARVLFRATGEVAPKKSRKAKA